jgi:hypothetical protein
VRQHHRTLARFYVSGGGVGGGGRSCRRLTLRSATGGRSAAFPTEIPPTLTPIRIKQHQRTSTST